MLLSRTLLASIAVVLAASVVVPANAKPTSQKTGPPVGHNRNKKKNPTQTFCSKFNAQCYLSAIQHHNGGGEVQVVHACKRKGKKYSKSFAFGCKADGDDITQQVLDQIGGGYTVATSSVTTTITTPYSVTATAPTSTITTFVSTSTSVSTSFTSTSTQVLLGTDEVPVVIVSVPTTPVPRRKRAAAAADAVDPSAFCSAFSAGCGKECARVSSTPKHTICQAGKQNGDSLQYKLACYCKNRKVETQHALRDTFDVATISTISTSTSLFTVTASTPTTVATTTPVTATPATTTTTTTMLIASTTQILVAATGVVEVINQPDSSSLGHIYKSSGNAYMVADPSNAQRFVAVRDATSGLYSLRYADNSGTAVILEEGISGSDLQAGSSNFGLLEPGTPSQCGTAATKGAPADGSGNYYGAPCEVFVFGAQADAQTLVTGGASLNFTLMWYNTAQTTPKQFFWAADSSSDLYSMGDVAAFNAFFGAAYYQARQVTFRFTPM